MDCKTACIVILFVACMLAAAGCTGTGNAPAPESSGISPSAAAITPAAPAVDRNPAENESPGEARNVIVNIEKDYLAMIHATYQGGPGHGLIRKIVVTVNRSDDIVTIFEIGTQIDDSGSTEGTKAGDRVMVHATYNDGNTYKIYDELVAYRPR